MTQRSNYVISNHTGPNFRCPSKFALRRYLVASSSAELIVGRIIKAVERLEIFPESGRKVPERNEPEIREVIVTPYCIVYRLRMDAVEIVTVFRASRLLPAFR
jgi:toxin ParE1/3/4